MIQTEEKMLKAVGQFFYGENFNEPAFVVARGMNGFKLDNKTLDDMNVRKNIKSVRWLANFKPRKSGAYTFTINPNCFAHILIDGENAKDQEMQLEAGKSYPFMVAYFGNPMAEQEELLQLDVDYTLNQQETKEIEVETFSIPEIISFENLPMGTDSKTEENKQPMLDTDDDGIYDDWEVNGYYIKNHLVLPWPKKGSEEEKELIKQGFKKFVSNPNESHTAGDPYSDLEKASGAFDRTIHKAARDPLVAAYPSITVGMEELVLSNNKNISSTEGKTVSRSTSSSVSDSNTEGIDASVGFSLFEGFSASVTGHYSHSSTHTVDSSNTSGQDWQHQLELNTGQSAYMNANVRYYNTGTAPVYNLVPTTNLVLGRQTVTTVTGQLNQRSLSLAPGQTYPKQHLHGVALNTLDQFSSAPIALNINQLDRLESGEKLKLETTQFQGAFARRSPAGGQVVLEENEWAHYMPQIESVTAGILINMGGNRFMERRIAAKDPLNPNDRTPELTLGEALEKSIGMYLDEENKNFYFINEETGTKHIISPDLVHLVYDTKTDKKIREELNKTIGEYQIVSSIGENKVADLADNKVVIYGNHEGNNQKWRFTFNRDKQAYKITSVSNPKLALTWDSKDSDKIFGYAGDYDSQYWRVERTSDGYFTLRNYKNPKMVLDLPDSNTTNSNQLKAYKDNGGSENQKWHLQNTKKNPDGKTIYDMTIQPGMNIQINVPVLYDDFTEKSGQWDGGDYDKENALYKGQCYKIPKKEVGVYSDFSLERNAVYLIVMAIKGSEAGNFTVEINGVTGTKEIGNFIVDKDYKYEKMVLKTFGDMEQHLELLIKNHTQSPVYIDNFSVIKIGKGMDELRKENIKYAENLKSDEIFYISPISDETTVITNLNNKAYMRKKSTNEKQFFRFDFNNIDNSFTIIDGSATTGGFEYVLKWNGDSEITFDVVATLKLDSWYLKKSTNPDQMGYQFINVWDRSKVLEYVDGEEKDGWPIEIATLDENNPSQYFQFPQKIKDLILWVSRKDENINVTNMNPIVVPKDFKNKDEEREIDLLFYSEGRVDMNQYEIKIGNPDLLRVTTDSEWKKKGHLNFKITNNLTGHADIKIVDAQAKSTFKTFTIQVE